MAKIEDREIVEVHTGTLAAGRSAALGRITIPSGMCGEVDMIYGMPDIDAYGVSNLDFLRPFVGGVAVPKLSFKFNHVGMNMLRPFSAAAYQPPIRLGWAWCEKAVVEGLVPRDPLFNTTIKLRSNDTFELRAFAGESDVTEDFWAGYRVWIYEDDEAVREIYRPPYVIPSLRIITTAPAKTIKTVTVPGKVISVVDTKTFDSLPGGDNQSRPSLDRWIRYGHNRLATTPGVEFPMVNEVDIKQNLSLSLDEKQVLILEAFGVQPHANHKETWFTINDVPYPRTPPYRTSSVINVAPFGDDAETLGPRECPVCLKSWNETFKVLIRDTGTQIPALGTIVALWGRWIEIA